MQLNLRSLLALLKANFSPGGPSRHQQRHFPTELQYVALTSEGFLRDSAMRGRADERGIYSRCCGGVTVYPGFLMVRYIMCGSRLKWTWAEIGTGALGA